MQIDDAFEQFVNWRQSIGQRAQVRPLDDIGRFRRYAERLLWLVIGNVAAPGESLAVEVVEVCEAASGQEVAFDIGERPLDPAFRSGCPTLWAGNRKPRVRAKASISGAMTASAPEPAASRTLVLSMTQTGQMPSAE